MYINMDLVVGFTVGFFLAAVLMATIEGLRQSGKL